jgi:hypothetical protein
MLSGKHENLISIQWIFHDVYFYHFFLLKL